MISGILQEDWNSTIAAGIVSCNPDIEKLKANIDAAITQVAQVIIIDNASSNIEDIIDLVTHYDKPVKLIQNHTNQGVATALNQIFEYSCSNRFEWVLTLDQDSCIYPDMLECYRKYSQTADSISCLRDGQEMLAESGELKDIDNVEYCITSGNLVRADAWKKVGGFNGNLFIDMVDVDFCFRLRQSGFNIIRVNKICMHHELGYGNTVKIFGKEHFTGNYSAFRKYYIFRNMTYVIRKYNLKHQYYSYKRLAMLFAAIWIAEDQKIEKSARSIKGFLDGLKMDLGGGTKEY